MEANLDELRKTGDPVADEFVRHYFSDASLKLKLDNALKITEINTDWENFLILIPEAKWFDDVIKTTKVLPKITIKKATKFYQKKENYILQLLGLLSLPYCYAAADGAKVLFKTERMYKDVAKRLEETALFVKKMMDEKSFEPSGSGKIQLFKVRIMHAAARFYILKSNWDLALGYPVNQEDMAGTNLSFSLIVVRGLRKMGFAVSYDEQMAFISYWNYVGSLLGLSNELLPIHGEDAYELEKKISQRHFKESIEGKQLTQSLLNCFYALNDQKEVKNEEIAPFMRYLLGENVSDILAIPQGEFSPSKKLLLKIKVSIM